MIKYFGLATLFSIAMTGISSAEDISNPPPPHETADQCVRKEVNDVVYMLASIRADILRYDLQYDLKTFVDKCETTTASQVDAWRGVREVSISVGGHSVKFN